MAAHRYWRINVTAPVTAGQSVCINEFRLHDASGTLLTGTGTASAFSVYPGQAAALAFDGNETTFWNASDATLPQWLEYDFGSAVDVATVLIGQRQGQPANTPKDFTIQWSDDNSSWTTALTTAGAAFTSNDVQYLSLPLTAPAGGNYTNYRLRVTAVTSGVPGLAEVILAATVGGANLCSAGLAWASSIFAGTYAASKALDANNTTFWDASTAVPQSWGYSFPKPVAIGEIRLTAPPTGNQDNAPTAFTLDGSNDGITWTTITSQTTGSWTTNQQKTFSGAASSSSSAPSMLFG